MLDQVKVWVTNRIEERTTWDGAMLVGIGVLILIAKPIASLIAYAVIIYGAWTLITEEK
jgi:hypothetical protein